MDREYVIRHNVVDRYLRGELTPSEQEAFEAFYLDDADTLDELEASRALGTLPGSARVPASEPRRWNPRVTLGAVLAGLAIGVASTILFRTEPALDPVRQTLDLATLRGDDDRPALPIPGEGGLVLLRIALPPEVGAVDVRIDGPGGSLGPPVRMMPDTYGEVTVALHSAQLAPGTYHVRALAPGTGEVLVERALQAVVPP